MYESEVFAECGAWKNFIDLEESLSLDELIELYDMSVERQNRLAKVVASALGADVSDMPSKYDEKSSQPNIVHEGAYDPKKGGRIPDAVEGEFIESLPIGLGYSIIDE